MKIIRMSWNGLLAAALALGSMNADALDLDWSGEFRSEGHYLLKYSMDGGNLTPDPARATKGGYYIPGGGSSNALFQTLFLKLRPNVIVNDNVFIKSEWWVGDPIYGFYGNLPYTRDQKFYDTTFSRGSAITAQRLWAEALSDIGTVQVGRAPMNWGLGMLWNSGNGKWDRYSSTGDTVRLSSKFGSFFLNPSVTRYFGGNNVGGACRFTGVTDPISGRACDPVKGEANLTDYSLIFSYDNLDEEVNMGANYIRRIGSSVVDLGEPIGADGGGPAGSVYNTWSIFAQKKLGSFRLAAEVPILSGNVGSFEYKSWAIATEADWKISESWSTGLKVGHAPGQPSAATTPKQYRAFYFHPNYKLGLIMFNYALHNFAGPNTDAHPGAQSQVYRLSPFDSAITNAKYAHWKGAFQIEKWQFRSSLTFGLANESAGSKLFYNTWYRRYVEYGSGTQGKFLGWEIDLGTSFKWDDNLEALVDFGAFFPGSFYKFSNTAKENPTAPVLAGVAKLAVSF